MTDRQTRILRAKMLGALMREKRLETGKSLKDMAKLIGTTTSTLSSYEHGRKSISLPELELLAFNLDTPLRYFLSPSADDVGEDYKFDPVIMVTLRQRMIGAMLRKRRLEQGMSIRELAATVDMPTSRVSNYERGVRPIPIPDLESLADALQQSLDVLIDHEGPIGNWHMTQQAFERFCELPVDLRAFFSTPEKESYLKMAERLSKLDLHALQRVARALDDLIL
ncbi:MAG: helix-turn-helix transcriptional regulator [Anaerolineales bacterium]|nr:helix-turn-helix transcriptional regulator [Anaerolineales bacterium]TEU01642.1 MAG: XRE family transcriptional regulator [Anaerolineales bacterium]